MNNSTDNNDAIGNVICKFLSDSATQEESENLVKWLKESQKNRFHYFAVKRIWQEGHANINENEFLENSLERLSLRLALSDKDKNKDNNSFKFSFKQISVAATILILIGISSLLGIKLMNLSEFNQNQYEISVPLGSRTNIILPDGTDVWLNAGSKLIYNSDFGRRDRSVSLIGEAYFDVNKHDNFVFTVNTRDLDIRVHGTEFNVKSYPEEDITETTLVSGRVEVLLTEEGSRVPQSLFLLPNQKMTYFRDGRKTIGLVEEKQIPEEATVKAEPEYSAAPAVIVSDVVETEEYTSWKDGRLIFMSESLETLAKKLERFYNVQISFQDETIKNLSYTGTLEEVTIEEVLRAIARTSRIKFSIDKNQIVISN